MAEFDRLSGGWNLREPSHALVAEYKRTEGCVSLSNLVFDRQGRMYKRPRSRVKCAWLALRGWRLYYD